LSSRGQQEWYEELERCARLYSGFNEAVPFIRAIYECVDRFSADHQITAPVHVDPDTASSRLRAGCPLDLNPDLDTEHVVELLRRMSHTLVDVSPELRTFAVALEDSLDHFLADASETVRKDDVWGLRDRLVHETQLKQDLATLLFCSALSCLYRRWLQPTAEAVRTDLWEKGSCPICGEKPHFGMLRHEDGAKVLECWLCGTNWLHTRIKCPFCDNENQDDLGYFTVGDQEICRVTYCLRCHSYLKIFDARRLDSKRRTILAVHNLATLSHDLLARQEGFMAGSGLEWVNPEEMADRPKRTGKIVR
jgi:formate dehydrogenase accessory protein FdhE